MESKIKDNRKLTKYLLIIGLSVLILVFIIRMISLVGQERITDMPAIGELPYNPTPEKQLSKIEQFEKEKADAENPSSTNEEIIPLPKFPIIDTTATTPILPIEEKRVEEIKVSAPQKIHSSTKTSVPEENRVVKKSGNGKKFEYESNYITQKEEHNLLKEEAVITTQTKNPFGTIGGYQKEISTESNSAIFYAAEIYGDQKIENGGNVLIRNTEPITYHNISIPRNSVLYGQAKFSGNRVHVIIVRAKTNKGEYSVNLAVQDNDRIEGFYYKAAIDETVDKQKDEIEVNLPGKFGVLNKVAEKAISGTKDLMHRSQTLNLNEGYKLYIIPNNSNYEN